MAEDHDVMGPGRALDAAGFAVLLEAYGARAERWPADRRGRAEALLARADEHGASARRSLAEAAAFDRILAMPPVFDTGRMEKLAGRIAAAAGEAPAKVIVLPVGRSRPPVRPLAGRRSHWLASAVLAASLLVGVVIGPGSTGIPVLQEAADAIGLGVYVDQLASLPTEFDTSQDEDYL